METQVAEAFHSTLETYRSTLVAIGNAGVLACPSAGEDLQQNLLALNARLTSEAAPSLITDTKQQVEAHLQTWAENAAKLNLEKTNEVKDILSIVAKVAGEVGERDQRYTKSFGDLADRLQETTKLNDLMEIRQSLSKGVTDIKACVARMAKDGEESVGSLRAQLSTYETRLEEVERIAIVDQLTGLFNRRKIEAHLERQIKEGVSCSVIYLDLNGFKQINDTFGHAAGDDLLKQFADELRTAVRATDIVGRWGGDEFVVVVDGDYPQAKSRLGRMEEWINGEYILATTTGNQKINLTVAAGIGAWTPGESITDVLHNADAAMYAQKSRMKSIQS